MRLQCNSGKNDLGSRSRAGWSAKSISGDQPSSALPCFMSPPEGVGPEGVGNVSRAPKINTSSNATTEQSTEKKQRGPFLA